MRVCYLIQTYKNPKQINRLLDAIAKSESTPLVFIVHDFTHCHLARTELPNNLEIELVSARGGRADFSLLQGYLDAVDWLLNGDRSFDWLINLTGQDYPIQPIAQIENFLTQTNYDAFIEYAEVFSEQSSWGIREGVSRYCYKYKQLIADLPERQKDLLRPIKVINYLQSFFRVNFSYGLTFGIKTATPFNDNFICYGGSYFCTLSKKCVEYLYEFTKCYPDIVNYYRGSLVSSESFLQTILVNSKLFNLCNDGKRYYDFSGTRHGHPRILTVNDYAAIVQSDRHFARKFDSIQDEKVLDILDAKNLQDFSINSRS
jgi:hypothetical protein